MLRGKRLSEYPGLREVCDEMYSRHVRSPFLLSTLMDMYEEEAGLEGAGHRSESLMKAIEVDWTSLSILLAYLCLHED